MGPPPEYFYIFEALRTEFLAFCILQKWLSFHKNNYFIMQILTECKSKYFYNQGTMH